VPDRVGGPASARPLGQHQGIPARPLIGGLAFDLAQKIPAVSPIAQITGIQNPQIRHHDTQHRVVREEILIRLRRIGGHGPSTNRHPRPHGKINDSTYPVTRPLQLSASPEPDIQLPCRSPGSGAEARRCGRDAGVDRLVAVRCRQFRRMP
jgi:hypothetical protein